MKVVLDTNVLLMSLPKISKYRPIFDALLQSKFSLALSNEILQEYIEVIGQKTTVEIAQNLAELLLKLENVEQKEVFFRWNLISKDPDDNKFVDCAVAAGVQYVVSNDNHFKVLKAVKFPPVEIIDADTFLEQLASSQ
ncbi:putative toxin-antitoxin system toxin component, PIN family [Phaeodactylibacter xiamenensis]|uniref:putative toxin-antitoxin system toxin component, PIN family n=1 Tax=Phaeodactylibacter xiamenensis TaxID=1524460 RepID=UPI0024A7FBDA|nr:putative toxin-antitoxin system toxin component, PIN family [Phaeodactylibacter xiamenensis]